MYIEKLDYIVNTYRDTYHSTVKMTPVNVKSRTYIGSSIVRISKYKNIFVKCYAPNWSEEIFVNKKDMFCGCIEGRIREEINCKVLHKPRYLNEHFLHIYNFRSKSQMKP